MLAELAARAFPQGSALWTADDLFAFASRSGGVLLADPALSAGLILLQMAADEAEIVNLGVVPERRREGIGAGLLTDAERHAFNRGATRLFLEVAADNAPAIALYAGAGFVRVGARPSYYRRPDGERVDALILSKPLGPRDPNVYPSHDQRVV